MRYHGGFNSMFRRSNNNSINVIDGGNFGMFNNNNNSNVHGRKNPC